MRGFDARSGRTRWTFHTIPQGDEFGNETWGGDSWRETGKVGVWTMMSIDPELGYIYLPLNTAAPDYYGGHRPGANLFAESLVALDLETGERVWHFPDRPPRAVGLRPARRPEPARRHGGRPARQGGGADHQAGLHVRLRPDDRRAGVADRGAARPHRHGHRGRGAVADPAVSHAPGAVRLPGRGHRRSRRLHARDTPARDRGGRAVPHRPALHAAQPARHRRAARLQRRQLGRRGRRPRDGQAVRAVRHPLHPSSTSGRPSRARTPAWRCSRRAAG